MLPSRDTETVKRWFEDALKKAQERGLTKAAFADGLAKACGNISVQAVHGWIRTGRITKRNLALASAHLGVEAPFTADAPTAQEPAPSYGGAWPFVLVQQDEVARLSQRRVRQLERLIRQRLDEWAEDDTSSKRRAA